MPDHLQITVPGYEGRAAQVAAGSRIRITDVEGCQIGDLLVMAKADIAEAVSPAVARLGDLSTCSRASGSSFSAPVTDPCFPFSLIHRRACTVCPLPPAIGSSTDVLE